MGLCDGITKVGFVVFTLISVSCAEADPEIGAAPADSTDYDEAAANAVVRTVPGEERVGVEVYHSQGEELIALARKVERTDPLVFAALAALLAGPTEEEREKGVTSFFGPGTAGMLQAVRVEDGTATVDFQDFSARIPNASSSAGSGLLLGQLNATVFQFPEIERVTYRFEGSCERFWNWVQRGCEVVERG